jgi:hypothetical protein
VNDRRRPAPRPWSAVVLVAAFLGSLVAGFPSATPVAASSEGCDGVWVVVDAAVAAGPVTTRCAGGRPANGRQVLEAAGHHVEEVDRHPGMLCRIDGRPGGGSCANPPPRDAYWSYWHAEPGGEWRYSTRGYLSHPSRPEVVEGWAFGAGQPPSSPPPSNPPPPEPEPSPTPTVTASPTPSPSPTPTATREAGKVDPSPVPTGSPEGVTEQGVEASAAPDAEEGEADAVDTGANEEPPPGASSAATAPRQPHPSPIPRSATQRSDPQPPVELRDADEEVVLDRPGDGGAMAGLIAGGALAATIAGAGVFQARRRRLELDA